MPFGPIVRTVSMTRSMTGWLMTVVLVEGVVVLSADDAGWSVHRRRGNARVAHRGRYRKKDVAKLLCQLSRTIRNGSGDGDNGCYERGNEVFEHTSARPRDAGRSACNQYSALRSAERACAHACLSRPRGGAMRTRLEVQAAGAAENGRK